MRHGGTGREKPAAGSVLIVAVWSLFFLGALAVAVGSYVGADIQIAVAVRRRVAGSVLARAGADLAAVFVSENTNRWDGLTEECWNCDEDAFKRNTSLGDGSFSVTFTTRSGEDDDPVVHYGVVGSERNINLNAANEKLLTSLLHVVGGRSLDNAAEIAKAIVAWREPAKHMQLTRDRESQYYSTLRDPYACHHGAFQSLYELRLVRGMDDKLFDTIRPYSTLYGTGKINANTASPEVLATVFAARGVKSADATALVRGIVAARPKEKVLDFESDLSDKAKRHFASVRNVLTVRSTCFYGEAVGSVETGGSGRAVDSATEGPDSRAVFVVDEDGNTLYWHEH